MEIYKFHYLSALPYWYLLYEKPVKSSSNEKSIIQPRLVSKLGRLNLYVVWKQHTKLFNAKSWQFCMCLMIKFGSSAWKNRMV
jgi:hypothetical protein